MKHICFVLFLITTFFFMAPSDQVRAHILKTDGTIGAVIHVDPDDDPYVGVPSGLFFELKDTTGKFVQDECECMISIRTGDILIDSFPLSHGDTTYTFANKGIYTITLAGKPKQPESFQSFSLTYDIRVARESGDTQPKQNTQSWFIFAPFLGLTVACMIIWFNSTNRKKKTL
jgi:hypothetical protein